MALTLNKSNLTLVIGGTYKLVPTLDPENALATYNWTSSDNTKATVEDGVVTGVAEGSTTITVTSDTYTATCEVIVNLFDFEDVPAAVNVVETYMKPTGSATVDGMFRKANDPDDFPVYETIKFVDGGQDDSPMTEA